MKQVVHLYTLAYPYGTGEAFIDPEIPYLSAAFDEVHIHPLRVIGSERETAENITIHRPPTSEISVSLKEIFSLRRKANWKSARLKNFRKRWSQAKQHIVRASALESRLSALPKGVHYSYWFDDWATALSILSERKVIDGYVSRAHGFDLYNDRRSEGYFPYRHFQLSQAKAVYPISQRGVSYLKTNYPSNTPIEKAYLGTEDRGLASVPAPGQKQLLSCSSIIPLKRVGRIAEVHAATSADVSWSHIGGEEKEVKGIVTRDNSDFKGKMSHSQVLDYMKTAGVGALINLSTTEGIPVSIMEAISMGIPVIATDVGGVSEIVNEQTGHLVQVDTPTDELAHFIDGWETEKVFEPAFRVGVRRYWEDNFSAAKNYPLFCTKIKEVYAV